MTGVQHFDLCAAELDEAESTFCPEVRPGVEQAVRKEDFESIRAAARADMAATRSMILQLQRGTAELEQLRCEMRAQAALLVAAVGASLCVSTVQDSEHEASAHLVREPGLCTGMAGRGGAMWLPCAWCGCSRHRDELGDRMCYCDVCEGTWHEQPWLATEECVLKNVLMPRRKACHDRRLATSGGLPRPEACHERGLATTGGLPRPEA